MRVFISSTAYDLAALRKVAEGVVLEQGWHPVMVMEHRSIPAGPTVQACQDRVASCDLFLLIVGHRCGWIPPRTLGGDGISSITQIELLTWGQLARRRPMRDPVILMLTDPATSGAEENNEEQLNRASQLVFRERLRNSGLTVHGFRMAHDGGAEVALREFRSLLLSLLSKVQAIEADRKVQQTKSNAVVAGILGVLGGIVLANLDTDESPDSRTRGHRQADDWW